MFKEIILQCISVCLIALSFFMNCSKDNPTEVTTGSISGVVIYSTNGNPASGVVVATRPTTSSVTTDTAGHFTISNINAGNYEVIAGGINYYCNSVTVSVTANNSSLANIELIFFTLDWSYVPEGSFTMGSTTSDLGYYADEMPQHAVYLDAFYICKYEITNSQYKAFMDAGGYNNSAYWTAEGWTWCTNNNITQPEYWTSGEYNSGIAFPKCPVVGVNWYEAYAFCKWAGGRLPTEAQWEKAARHTDARFFAWGYTWDASKCNSDNNVSPDTFGYSSPVGYFPTGASYYDTYDMTGNVWEWCNDWYDSTYYSDPSANNNPLGPTTGINRVLRGGSWGDYYGNCRTAYRIQGPPFFRIYSYGIRPVK